MHRSRRVPFGARGLLLALVGGFLLGGCESYRPAGAVGSNDELSVFTNVSREGAAADEIRRLLGRGVDVMGKEPAFRLDWVPPDQFKNHRYVKNQLFAVDLSRRDSFAKSVPGYLGSVGEERIRQREPFRVLIRDLWATGQTTLFAVAWSPEDLRHLFSEVDSASFCREFEDAVVGGLEKTMFGLGEEIDLPRQTAADYGWTVRLPTGFFGAADPKGRFVKFNAVDPVRLLLVHWIEDELPLTREAWEPVLGRVLRVYNDGDFVLEERTSVYLHRFQEDPAVVWEGIWQNEEYVIGGAFRAFAFHRDGRSWLLVGQVFNPGGDKLYVLRQLEAILKTFRVVG